MTEPLRRELDPSHAQHGFFDVGDPNEQISTERSIFIRPVESFTARCPEGSNEFFMSTVALALQQPESIATKKFLDQEVKPKLGQISSPENKFVLDRLLMGVTEVVHNVRYVSDMAMAEVGPFEIEMAGSQAKQLDLIALLAKKPEDLGSWLNGSEESKDEALALLWTLHDNGPYGHEVIYELGSKLAHEGEFDSLIAARLLRNAVDEKIVPITDPERQRDAKLRQLVSIVMRPRDVNDVDAAIEHLAHPDVLPIWVDEHRAIVAAQKAEYSAGLAANTKLRLDYLRKNLLIIPPTSQTFHDRQCVAMAKRLRTPEQSVRQMTKEEYVAHKAADKRRRLVAKAALRTQPSTTEAKKEISNELWFENKVGTTFAEGSKEFERGITKGIKNLLRGNPGLSDGLKSVWEFLRTLDMSDTVDGLNQLVGQELPDGSPMYEVKTLETHGLKKYSEQLNKVRIIVAIPQEGRIHILGVARRPQLSRFLQRR